MESHPSALYFVLKYLPLYELLVMSRVCRSLRDAVNHDTLLWLDIIVDKPLHWRLSDNTLMGMASRAHGRLRRVALLNCHNLTDDGLHRLAQANPLLEKVYLPGCTGLTAEGIIRSVKSLTQRSNRLKSLKISGIYHLNKDHIATLESCLGGVENKTQQNQPLHYYHNYKNTSQSSGLLDDDHHRPIDVEICPRCDEVRMVFECTREACRAKGERSGETGCRGCCHCIPRCEECGVCIENEEEEEEEGGETVCAESLCLECWLHLPKCSFCNRPYCRRHGDEYLQRNPPLSAAGFVCEVCTQIYSDDL